MRRRFCPRLFQPQPECNRSQRNYRARRSAGECIAPPPLRIERDSQHRIMPIGAGKPDDSKCRQASVHWVLQIRLRLCDGSGFPASHGHDSCDCAFFGSGDGGLRCIRLRSGALVVPFWAAVALRLRLRNRAGKPAARSSLGRLDQRECGAAADARVREYRTPSGKSNVTFLRAISSFSVGSCAAKITCGKSNAEENQSIDYRRRYAID